ncbi:MAG: hypothetical protein ACRET6_00240, partial [Burkholderiales bacterium]
AYNSPEVEAGIARARRLSDAYDIHGTPSLVVDGRYLTSSSMVSTYQEMVLVLEDLILIARQNRGAK